MQMAPPPTAKSLRPLSGIAPLLLGLAVVVPSAGSRNHCAATEGSSAGEKGGPKEAGCGGGKSGKVFVVM